MSVIDDVLGARLTTAVAAKLKAPVTFSHWIKRNTGDIPVFNIPVSHQARARELALTFNRYFIHGAACDEATARAEFSKVARHYGADPSEIIANWAACQTSEEARDNCLPSHIEIIQGE